MDSNPFVSSHSPFCVVLVGSLVVDMLAKFIIDSLPEPSLATKVCLVRGKVRDSDLLCKVSFIKYHNIRKVMIQ